MPDFDNAIRFIHNLNLFGEVDLSSAPAGLTFATAHAAMAAMASAVSYTADRPAGDIFFEAVCGLAASPEVVEALHREVGHKTPVAWNHHDDAEEAL